MKETTKIYKGTLIYAVGNFSSRLLSFIMFPIYSYYLSSSEYGTYDLITSTISLMLPLLTLQVPEALMRFVSEEKKESVISTSLFLCCLSLIISFMAGGVISYVNELSIAVILWLELQMIVQYCMQITRALGKNLVYSISSVVSTLILTVSNIIMLIFLHMGIKAMIYSGVIAAFCSMVFLIFKNRIWQYFHLRDISLVLLKRMIKFSIPIIPTALIWWVMNSSDKYVINYFLGSGANGIYAISYKFPTIVTILYGFYNLSWQDYVFLEKKKINFSPIIQQFISMIIWGSVIVMYVAKLVSQHIVEISYYESYLYIPPIIIGMVFYCFSCFLGIAYRKLFNTNKEFFSSLLGAIINIIINLLFVRWIGLWSAALSTMISFIIVAVIRYLDTRKFFDYNIVNIRNMVYFLYLLISCGIYYINNLYVSISMSILSVVLFFVINKSLICDMIGAFKKKLVKNE